MSKANSSRIKEAAQRRYIVQISHDCCHLAIHFRRVLDDASRQRRARKALENLEQVLNVFPAVHSDFFTFHKFLTFMCVNFLIMQDNNCDDPHADLVMSKKALSLFQEEEEHGQRKTKRKVIVFLTLFHKIFPF